MAEKKKYILELGNHEFCSLLWLIEHQIRECERNVRLLKGDDNCKNLLSSIFDDCVTYRAIKRLLEEQDIKFVAEGVR